MQARYTQNLGDLLKSISMIDDKLVLMKTKLIHYMENDVNCQVANEAYLYCIPSINEKTFSLWDTIEVYMNYMDPHLV